MRKQIGKIKHQKSNLFFELNSAKLVSNFYTTLMLVVSNRKLSTHIMVTPTEVVFFLTEVFFPVHADSPLVGASDMSPEVHCNIV